MEIVARGLGLGVARRRLRQRWRPVVQRVGRCRSIVSVVGPVGPGVVHVSVVRRARTQIRIILSASK